MAFLNNKVAETIDSQGIKRRFVARKLGLSDARFSMLINGRLQVRAEEMLRLADLLDLEPEEILREEAVA